MTKYKVPTVTHLSLPFACLCWAAAPVIAQAQTTPSTSEPTALPDVVVRAAPEPVNTYTATNATTAAKIDIPLLETPQAVSVLPETLLRDQNVRKLEDALRNVAGVTVGGYYSDWDYYRIRGFDAAFTTFIDGLRGDYGTYAETYGLERVEVVKGPASPLYGQGPLGGMVNLVSKRPRPEPFADFQFTLGSWQFYEPAVDLNAPLNEEGTLYGRFTALYRTRESFVDYAYSDRVFIAPALTWEISPQTSLTFLTHFMQDWSLLAMPLPAAGTVLPNPNGEIPISRFIGEPGSDPSEIWRAKVGYELRHQFNHIFSLRQNVSLNRMDQNWPNLYYPSSLDPDGRTLYRYPYNYRETLDRLAADTALEARFETGIIEHSLVGGVDYYRTRSDNTSDQIDYSDFPGSYPALDLFNPVYGAPLPPYATTTRAVDNAHLWGLYLQDHMKLFERLTVTLGGRFDWSSSGDDDADDFTPRTGITYALTPGLAVYGNWSQSFNPQWFSRNQDGDVVDPETGENFEVGLKSALLDGRLQTLLAVYHLTRENVATSNPATPDPFDSIAAGEQRSRGIEVEGAFEITPGWDLTAAYTFFDAEVTRDNNIPQGARLQGVPKHAFNAWMKYTFQDGPLAGLGFGLGGRYYTDQQGDATYTQMFELPAYGIMDAAVYYSSGPFHAQVNVNNVLDEDYFAGAYNSLYVLPGEPINVRATVGYSF